MKKNLTEAEHIRSMLQEMDLPETWMYTGPDPDDPEEPQELVDFLNKVYDYEKKIRKSFAAGRTESQTSLKSI